MLHPAILLLGHLLPKLGLDLDAPKDIPRETRLQRGSELGALLGRASDIEAAGVLLGTHVHAPESVIGKPKFLGRGLRRGDVDRVWEGGRERGGQFLERDLGVVVDCAPSLQARGELGTALEGTVADQFGVDSAVTGVVDVLVFISHLSQSPWQVLGHWREVWLSVLPG